MIKISPSLLAADFCALGDEAMRMQRSGADLLHVDVMDGHFVKNLTIGVPVISSLKKRTGLPLDVHLMIENPGNLLDEFIEAGADLLTLHIESVKSQDELRYLLQKVEKAGVIPSISIKPATPAEVVFPLLDSVGMVLVMTVEPGFGGQKLIESTLQKVASIRRECLKKGLDTDIQVDGGITSDTICAAAAQGANVFVSGSAIFSAKDPAGIIAELRRKANDSFCSALK